MIIEFDSSVDRASEATQGDPVANFVLFPIHQTEEQRLELCRQLWAELHLKQDATPEWFSEWLARVPNFGCGCRDSFAAYLLTNPPRYDDWYAWTCEAHDWVNAKLGKPLHTER